jgi:hypothetical protein
MRTALIADLRTTFSVYRCEMLYRGFRQLFGKNESSPTDRGIRVLPVIFGRR